MGNTAGLSSSKPIIANGPYSRRQEIVNGLIHGFGILVGVSGLPVLTGIATAHANTPGIVGAGIYGFSFLFVFTSSTIYHFSREEAIKQTFKILDHISIYFLIAGTYTPFLLIYIPGSFGVTLLSVLWGLTGIGLIVKIRFTGRFEVVSTIIYLLMGWIMVVGGRRFFDSLPKPVLIFILAGAALYSMGVTFYLRDRRVFSHAIWHAFVLAAALCHYVAVLLAM